MAVKRAERGWAFGAFVCWVVLLTMTLPYLAWRLSGLKAPVSGRDFDLPGRWPEEKLERLVDSVASAPKPLAEADRMFAAARPAISGQAAADEPQDRLKAAQQAFEESLLQATGEELSAATAKRP